MKRNAIEEQGNLYKKIRYENIFDTVKIGNLEAVFYFIQQKEIDINAVDDSGDEKTVLQLAAERGFTEIAKLLLDNNAKVDVVNGYGTPSPLYLAAQEGYVDVVDLLLTHGSKSFTRYENIDEISGETSEISEGTCLHVASRNGHIAIVKLLLQNGVDVDERDEVGRTALHESVFSHNTAIIKILLENNADINAQDKALHTPLHLAVNTGRIDTIQLLLEYNAGIDFEDEDERTPLDFAIERYIYEYPMSSIFIQDPPTLNMSNIYQKNIPLLIKDGDNKKWIYGYTSDGQVSLKQLVGDPSFYETINFTDQFSLLDKKRVHPIIYLDIAKNK